jgi:hypothetical membrane protein
MRKMNGGKRMANIPRRLSRANLPGSSQLVDTPQSLAQRLLLMCGIVGPVLFIVAFLIEGALHPGYNLLRQTISELEVLTNGWMQIANFLLFGLLIACFAIGLRNALGKDKAATCLALLEGCVALGLIGDGIFLIDPFHTICDIVTFTGGMLASFVFAWRVVGDPRWRGWTAYSIATGILLVIFLILFGVTMTHNGLDGLFERLAALTRAVWTVFLAARLLAGTRLSPLKAGPSSKLKRSTGSSTL